MSRKISLVTGGFDPSHSGHIDYFVSAKNEGDFLLVGINSDEWLERKKGKYFLDYKERATVIKELYMVNDVIDFDDSDDTAIDAIKKISEIEIPGFGELFRQLSYNKIGTSTIQSRSSAFLVNKKYIFCLPGSSSAVLDAWNDILFYQLDIRHKPCNFIELIPRLDE